MMAQTPSFFHFLEVSIDGIILLWLQCLARTDGASFLSRTEIQASLRCCRP
jgi:hypothetical protein